MLRRRFLGTLGSCTAHLMAASVAGPAAAKRMFAARPRGRVVAEEPWGRLEQLADGIWALVSTPASLGEWVIFSPRYYEVAFRAWQQELRP